MKFSKTPLYVYQEKLFYQLANKSIKVNDSSMSIVIIKRTKFDPNKYVYQEIVYFWLKFHTGWDVVI